MDAPSYETLCGCPELFQPATSTSPDAGTLEHLLERSRLRRLQEYEPIECDMCLRPGIPAPAIHIRHLLMLSPGDPFDQDFPQLKQLLKHLHHHRAHDKRGVYDVLHAFFYVCFDALDAYEYIRPWERRSRDVPNRDMEWATRTAKHYQENTLAIAHDIVGQIDYDAIFEWLVEIVFPAHETQCAFINGRTEYLGWRLWKWIERTATDADVADWSICETIFAEHMSIHGGGTTPDDYKDFRPSCWNFSAIDFPFIQETEDEERNGMPWWNQDMEMVDVVVEYEPFETDKYTCSHAPATDGDALDCRVCLSDDDQDKFLALKACGHAFHRACLESWANSNRDVTCPLCRCSICERERLPDAEEVETDDEEVESEDEEVESEDEDVEPGNEDVEPGDEEFEFEDEEFDTAVSESVGHISAPQLELPSHREEDAMQTPSPALQLVSSWVWTDCPAFQFKFDDPEWFSRSSMVKQAFAALDAEQDRIKLERNTIYNSMPTRDSDEKTLQDEIIEESSDYWWSLPCSHRVSPSPSQFDMWEKATRKLDDFLNIWADMCSLNKEEQWRQARTLFGIVDMSNEDWIDMCGV